MFVHYLKLMLSLHYSRILMIQVCLLVGSGFFASTGSLASQIYRDPDSSFSSGDEPITQLKMDGTAINRTWIKMPNGKWISRKEILTIIDFSDKVIARNNTLLLSDSHDQARPVATVKVGETLKIIKIENSWVKVSREIKSGLKMGWIQEKQIGPDPGAFGFIYTKSPIIMRIKPNFTSHKVRDLPELYKIKPLKLQGPWLFVKDAGYQGWIHISDVYSKLDFAEAVLPQKENEYRKVKFHQGSWIETKEAHFYTLQKIAKIKTSERIFLVKKSKVMGKIMNTQTVTWQRAYSRHSGTVWFAENNIFQKKENTEIYLSNDDFFQRKIFDMAEHPLLPDFKLASSRGIFKTTDSMTWEKIERFGEENYPVCITQSGTMFVGPYVSHNAGNSFQSYLRFDKLLNAFYKAGKKLPSQLLMTAIDYNETGSALHVTFNSTLTLESADAGKNWLLLEGQHKPQESVFSRRFAIQIDRPWSSPSSLSGAKSEHKRLATIVSY